MKLLIRCDAGTRIGLGHAMRCLALAQALKEAGTAVTFAMARTAAEFASRLTGEGMGLELLRERPGTQEDARETARHGADLGATWIVADGYDFGSDFQESIRHAGFKLLAIDDYGHSTAYSADYVLNQNICAHERLYTRRAPHTHLLLGCRYVLLRKEFAAWRNWARPIEACARHVLVTLGGSDPDNVTLKVMEALRKTVVDGMKVVVLVGAANPHLSALTTFQADGGGPFELLQHTEDVPALLAWADFAITAGGITVWEAAFMGLPGAVIAIASNQRQVAEALGEVGCASNMGFHTGISSNYLAAALTDLLGSAQRRALMSRRGRELVDGLGSTRVVEALRAV